MTDENDELADKIVDRMIKRIYQEVGKGVLRKMFWLTLVVILAAAVYFGLVRVP